MLFFIFHFIGLSVLQNSNNALPFFFKDYPTYPINGKKNFDYNSESLVLNRIDYSTLGVKYDFDFNLWHVNADIRAPGGYETNAVLDYNFITSRDYLLDGIPYKSQIGAQARLWAEIAELTDIKHGNYYFLRMLSVLFISMFSALILLWIYVNFGHVPSVVGSLFFISSTGINIFSQSLYWSVWLFILPLSVVCLLDLLNIKRNFLIFCFLLPVFLLKFLSGYEFITIVVLSAVIPYAWDFIINKNSSSGVRGLCVGLSSIFAFIISLAIYNHYFNLDFKSSGIDYILSRSDSWSANNFGLLGISVYNQLSKILIMNFFDFNGYGVPLGVMLVAVVAFLYYLRDVIQVKDIIFIIFLFLSSLSWFIFQFGHILFHPRYAMLVFFLPFGFFVTSFITVLFCKYKNQLARNYV